MKVTLTKKYGDHQKGETIEVSKARGEYIIRTGGGTNADEGIGKLSEGTEVTAELGKPGFQRTEKKDTKPFKAETTRTAKATGTAKKGTRKKSS